ncbi:hypothetical protein P4H66_12495 [Paenibacillus dokdonensis]|uniref:Two-component sensor histidine kinase n=1 Tax=Paenibacillus dokdonensis TaxID=2567944 RepID=A0ABU6GR98_9BACL|nr:hypothetical protein [Paenibacillus dokdonensis]MEC0240667.1 hypothetical protein [Paenibacillus dokdonensis]
MKQGGILSCTTSCAAKIILALSIAVSFIAILYAILSAYNYRNIISLDEQMKDHFYATYIKNLSEFKDEVDKGIKSGAFDEENIVELNRNRTRTRINDYFYAYQSSVFPLKEDKSVGFQKVRDIYLRFNNENPRIITSQTLPELKNSYKKMFGIIEEAINQKKY